MSSKGSIAEESPAIVLYEAEIDESSEEPPIEEWSSLLLEAPEENKKKLLFAQGAYEPGSGEICAKYIAMSASSVFRHAYYNYPSVPDPGIKEALLHPEEKLIYPDDGQELYLAVCKEMAQCPVRIFHRNLVDKVINLQYYCVNPYNVRAMSIALRYNRNVKVLNFSDCFLNDDACFHLGEMLVTNSCIEELNLKGCRIGSEGAKRLLKGLSLNRTIITINLSENELGDTGLEYISNAIFQGLDVKNIYLRRNSIGSKGASALSEAFETLNNIIIIDLSWNNFFSPAGIYNLLNRIGEGESIQLVDLSWCSLIGERIANGLKNLLQARNLRSLNLSHNRLSGTAISILANNLCNAKKLMTLDLSYNPMDTADALNIISKIKLPKVKVQKLLLENIAVDGRFLEILHQMRDMKSKKDFSVIYGGVSVKFQSCGVDMRDIVLNRAEFLGKKPKKNPIDVALLAMQILKDKNQIMLAKDFSTAMKELGAPLDSDLIDEIINTFPGSRTPKSKTIDVSLLVDYVHRKWPDRKLPPTPPPEPEPEPIHEITINKKGKGKKK